MSKVLTKTAQRKVASLAQALIEGKEIVSKIPCVDHGGACNFDSPHVILKRWRESTVQDAADLAGVTMSKWVRAGVWRVAGYDHAQGHDQTIKAEKFTEALKRRGFDAYTHYALD